MHFCTAVDMNEGHCWKIIMIIEEFMEAEKNLCHQKKENKVVNHILVSADLHSDPVILKLHLDWEDTKESPESQSAVNVEVAPMQRQKHQNMLIKFQGQNIRAAT